MPNSFFNSNLIPIIRKLIKDFNIHGKNSFLTSELITKQLGRYVNDNCSASHSFNANYGKFLKEHSHELQIIEIHDKIPFKDKYGKSSTCSEWEILN